MTGATRPVLDDPTRLSLFCSFAAIAAATFLLVALARQMVVEIGVWHWSFALAAIAGVATADLLSGLIHWAADTWGRDDTPLIGPTILVPFRVHHVNPDDFLRRRFLDTNGHVALVTLPLLLALFVIPLQTNWGALVMSFGYPLCAAGLITNQVHQWAHMVSPPAPVRMLQDCGILLGRAQHAEHHRGCYDGHYCITTGWCNGALEAIGFFRRLESAGMRVTGVQPRLDDARYEARFGIAPGGGAA